MKTNYLLLILTICIAGYGTPTKQAEEKPNIVFILVDDLGYNHLGVYGQKKINTPNIDKLAEQGMRFTQFYAGPNVCGSSRVALMLGLHTGHIPFRNNGDNQICNDYEPIGRLHTIGELFKNASYKTGYFGKYGIGGPEDIETGQKPNDRGFDEFYGLLNHGHGHYHYPAYVWHNSQKVRLNNKTRKYEGNKYGKSSLNPEERKEHTDDIFSEKAVEFIKSSSKTNQPFFCFLSFTMVHTEMLPNDKFAEPYRKQGWEEYDSKNNGYHVLVETPKANFAGMVSMVDHWTGTVLNTLEKLNLEESTLAIFTSDNGGQLRKTWGDVPSHFFEANGVLRGGKEYNYEGGIRVPLIIKWPSVINENSTNEHIGYFPDFKPTFAEILNIQLTEKTDGISLVPIITGNKHLQNQHEYLYWERPVHTKKEQQFTIHPTHLRQAIRMANGKQSGKKQMQILNCITLKMIFPKNMT